MASIAPTRQIIRQAMSRQEAADAVQLRVESLAADGEVAFADLFRADRSFHGGEKLGVMYRIRFRISAAAAIRRKWFGDVLRRRSQRTRRIVARSAASTQATILCAGTQSALVYRPLGERARGTSTNTGACRGAFRRPTCLESVATQRRGRGLPTGRAGCLRPRNAVGPTHSSRSRWPRRKRIHQSAAPRM